jgi:hypothetical protein
MSLLSFFDDVVALYFVTILLFLLSMYVKYQVEVKRKKNERREANR